jgi:hypothetical protein
MTVQYGGNCMNQRKVYESVEKLQMMMMLVLGGVEVK